MSADFILSIVFLSLFPAAAGVINSFAITHAVPAYTMRRDSWRPIAPDEECVNQILGQCDSSQRREVLAIRDALRTDVRLYREYGERIGKDSYFYLAYLSPLAVGRLFFDRSLLFPIIIYLVFLVVSYWWFRYRRGVQTYKEDDHSPFPPPPLRFDSPDAFIEYWTPIRTKCNIATNERIEVYDSMHKQAKEFFILIVIAIAGTFIVGR